MEWADTGIRYEDVYTGEGRNASFDDLIMSNDLNEELTATAVS